MRKKEEIKNKITFQYDADKSNPVGGYVKLFFDWLHDLNAGEFDKLKSDIRHFIARLELKDLFK